MRSVGMQAISATAFRAVHVDGDGETTNSNRRGATCWS